MEDIALITATGGCVAVLLLLLPEPLPLPEPELPEELPLLYADPEP